ncbi:HNH endonuclease family protein [Amycolatopsis sp. NPDC004772]
MPQSWQEHWSNGYSTDPAAIQERNHRVQTLGNLTLVTARLNPVISNSPWPPTAGAPSPEGKRVGINAHSVLLLNKRLVDEHPDEWTDQAIDERTLVLGERITEIWRRQS